ncbi:mitochondrial import inner membrane translocase subunit Tim29 [Cephus cinctus]|uniref:Mitochondrial import inner membrane translocase subunit Tim29 n=1 Tax=Cephus cinctus TaxID=211228 RepID=A0AAJ7C5B5_CEPCN|nr:mitochondrial import inner membrane translocase subunit Tim29 [Cephus cinctus]
MALSRIFSLRSRMKSVIDTTSNKLSEIATRIENFETPEKIKGTILERWGKYWKNLYIDYKDVAIDVAKDCRERPIRATFYFSTLASCYYFAKHNPDESSYREQLLQDSIKVMTVGESIRNPETVQHIKWIEQCYNEGVIRRLSLGIISFIWLDNYDEVCAHYKATCSYLKPRYLTFHERIVDIGFMDKWWILEKKMVNYDINEAEFENSTHKNVENSILPS